MGFEMLEFQVVKYYFVFLSPRLCSQDTAAIQGKTVRYSSRRNAACICVRSFL